MKFLVDAQLPRRLSELLRTLGHDSLHTLDLPAANRTTDDDISSLSLAEQRVVISKDTDFVNSFLLHREPYKLLVVATGNIRNADLLDLFRKNIDQIADLFSQHDYLELTGTSLIVHS